MGLQSPKLIYFEQIFFLALLLISEVLFITQSLPLLPITFSHSRLRLLLHCALIPLLVIPPYIFLHLSNSTRSAINPLNHASAMLTYPYDHAIFYGPGLGPLSTPPCRSCQLPKPARSKHCSICRSCIQKADHHCIWINNCVGRNNYVYFLALMLSLSLLLAYGAYLGYKVLDRQIQIILFQHSSPPTNHHTLHDHHWAHGLTWKRYGQRWSDILTLQPLIAAPALLALFSCPLAAGLTMYHLYLIWAGMTTNESGKWADLREDIGDERVWRGRIEDLGDDFAELVEGSWRGMGPVSWPLQPTWLVVTMEEPGRRPRVRRRENKRGEVPNGGGVACVAGEGEQCGKDERWILVRSLAELENIYDLGFWDNLRDVVLNRE